MDDFKILKCRKCKEKVEVGEQTTGVLCGNCTSDEYTEWMENEIKKQKYYEDE